MRQGKFRIAFDGCRQVFDGARECFVTIGVTFPETSHEFVVSLRVATVPVGRLRHSSRNPSLQRFHHAAPDFVLHPENVFSHEVMLFRIRDLLRRTIEELRRDAPVWSELLDVSLQHVADAQVPAGAGPAARCRC